jgi:ADP-dependent NAD(P)H-hydrate dehydratase / NAD(P)H-hydrate epimerase
MVNKGKRLYQISQIRLLEKLAIEQYGLSEVVLMQRAGRAAFTMLCQKWPDAKKILIICGKGNNGGDGYVLARLASEQGFDVSVRYLGELAQVAGAAGEALNAFQAITTDLKPFTLNEPVAADVIVDAILGIGVKGDLKDIYRDAINAVNDSHIPVLAIDIPSGIDADTGCVWGGAVVAAVTVTFIGLKSGLFTSAAPAYVGEIVCEDLGLPSEAFQQLQSEIILLTQDLVSHLLPKRHRDAQKGDFGHVLVIGGDYGMAGAARLAAEAAARTGAGLVSVATRPEHVSIITTARPEIMCHGVNTLKDLLPLIDKASVVIIGPGLGQQQWGKDLLRTALNSGIPKVVDADALNLIAKDSIQSNDWILTPHPGEAARLLGESVQDIQHDRFMAVKKLQEKYDAICVLKGVGSLIKGESYFIYVCSAGNPGMASGGMGDALSGIIGGILAQGLTLEDAARLGVLVHALAGDLAAKRGERGLLALDVIAEIRTIMNDI